MGLRWFSDITKIYLNWWEHSYVTHLRILGLCIYLSFSAAHCLYPRSFGAVKFVKLGMNYRNEQSGKIYIFGVDKIFQHPNYSARNFIEDIGLLRLNGSVTFSEFILPICLPTKQHDSGRAVVSGFGRTGYGQSSSEKLLKVTLEKFTADECQQAFGKAINVDNGTMLCYGHHTENKDSCSVSGKYLLLNT